MRWKVVQQFKAILLRGFTQEIFEKSSQGLRNYLENSNWQSQKKAQNYFQKNAIFYFKFWEGLSRSFLCGMESMQPFLWRVIEWNKNKDFNTLQRVNERQSKNTAPFPLISIKFTSSIVVSEAMGEIFLTRRRWCGKQLHALH